MPLLLHGSTCHITSGSLREYSRKKMPIFSLIGTNSYGYNLHPRIQDAIQGKENLHIADIGTGTGWAYFTVNTETFNN